jgi:hypothetical protein
MNYTICGCLPSSYVITPDYNMVQLKDLKVGDAVLGAFGGINTVKEILIGNLGLDFMMNIDKNLTCLERTLFWNSSDNLVSYGNIPTYGTFNVGDPLKCLNNASRKIETIERLYLPNDTKMYNLLLDGDHSCFINGYAMLAKQARGD